MSWYQPFQKLIPTLSACTALQGWGVHATKAICCGTFIALYIGHYITNSEADARLKRYDAAAGAGNLPAGHALLVSAETWRLQTVLVGLC